MDFGNTDVLIAEKKISLKNKNSCLSFVSTLWKGEVIMCCFDNKSLKLANVFCRQELSQESFDKLEEIVFNFVKTIDN